MSADFDSTQIGHRYSRVQRLVIDYPAPMVVRAVVNLQDHVPCDDGTHQPVGEVKVIEIDYGPAELASMGVPLRDLNTGELLGQDMALSVIFTGVMSAIRKAQVEAAGN